MIFAELPLDEAAGALLAHGLELDGRRVAKGTPIDAALLAAARGQGLERLWAARPEPGDVGEAEAAARLGAAIAGAGIAVEPPVHGRVNLVARAAGLLATEGVGEWNARSDDIGLATLAPLSPVAAGALVATLKVIPFALSAATLAALLAAPARLALLPYRTGLSARLVVTRSGAPRAKVEARTSDVTAARLAALGIALDATEACAHAVAPLARLLAAAPEPLLLVAGATATADRRDVIPAAIAAAGGELLRVGLPVDPGNLLVLGRLGARHVIGLPGCAKSPKRNGLDLVLEALAAGLPLDAARLAGMGVGGLLEGSGGTLPWGWAG